MKKQKAKTKHFARVPNYKRVFWATALMVCCGIGVYSNASDSAKSSVLWIVWGLACLLTSFLMGLYTTISNRRDIDRCVPMIVMCDKYRLDESQVRRFAAERGVEPRYNIGGKLLYRMEDFEDAGILLRPAQAPEQLLQAASYVEQPDELLVRPAEGK